jgi:hypothetical protein
MDPSDALIAFGDSVTWGTELKGCTDQEYSLDTWTALCAKDLGVEYRCLARGGVGNQFISSSVFLKYTSSIRKYRNFYVVNWTWIDRFDYIDIDTNIWRTIHPQHHNKLSHFFYKHIDNVAWNLMRNLQIIYATIQFLEANDCDFFMTCQDETLFTKDYAIDHTPMISTLQSFIKPYMNYIENQNFLDWSKDKGFPIGPGGHPLEEAHAAAAPFYLDKIRSRLRFAGPR